MTLRQLRTSLHSGWRTLTVEPILFLFMFSGSFMWLTLQALIYQKVCLECFNQTVCDNLHLVQNKDEEDTVQAKSSHWFLARIVCDEIPAILSSLFYGNLSDHVSRKMALLLPLVGMVIANATYLVNAMLVELPMWTILLGSVGSGLFGGWIACSLSVYSYLSFVTESGSRTVRMATAECLTVLGSATGHLASGYVLDRTGYAFTLSISLMTFTFSVWYVLFYVSNLPHQSDADCNGCLGTFGEMFSPRSLTDSSSVVFRPRLNRNRFYIVLLLISMCLSVLGGSATWTLGYLYVRRQPLSWSQTLYGYYIGLGHTVKGLVVITVLPIIKVEHGMNETSIVIVALALHAVAEVMFGLCTKTWMVFAVLLVDILYGAVHTCYRSLLSTMVGPNEYGQIFATLGSLQSVCILVASSVYNVVYPLTLDIWAGLCFTMGAGLLLCGVVFIMWIHVDKARCSTTPTSLPVSNESSVCSNETLGLLSQQEET